MARKPRDRTLYRSAQLRGKPAEREAVFVAATENPVETPWGREVLRMSGCDLARYKGNTIVLDSHRRGSISDVIGCGKAEISKGRLLVRVRYAKTPLGEEAWQLVKGGFLRAVSIGYAVNPDKVRRVREGETVDGVEGPALIVDEWELLEVSNVPVPADAEAVKRDVYSRALATGRQRARAPRAPQKDRRPARVRAMGRRKGRMLKALPAELHEWAEDQFLDDGALALERSATWGTLYHVAPTRLRGFLCSWIRHNPGASYEEGLAQLRAWRAGARFRLTAPPLC